MLKNGITVNGETHTLSSIVSNNKTSWVEQEWEFPKGEETTKKTISMCTREFQEETGFSRSNIDIIENVIPYEEYFIGSNYKAYKHKFYLAYTNQENMDLTNFQTTEVSKMAWMNIDQCVQAIRPYNLEKKNVICNINKMLREYSFYS